MDNSSIVEPGGQSDEFISNAPDPVSSEVAVACELPRPTSAQNRILCESCAKIDFESILQLDESTFPREGVQVWAKDILRKPGDVSQSQAKLDNDQNENGFYTTMLNEVRRVGFLEHQSTAAIASPVIHTTLENEVNYAMLASGLNHCMKTHRKCGHIREKKSPLPYLKLIDCIKGSIVLTSPAERYLALSYVWDKSTSQSTALSGSQNALSTAQAPLTDAPLTIRDAVIVVRNLGRRYLWVDKLCIDHADIAERSLMIRNMDSIYENAEATIVALNGEHAGSGLPGVSTVTRVPQPSHIVAEGRLVSSCPPILAAIHNTTWAARGWTYQEARLSRRCLFFSSHQVYLVCNEITRSEALPGVGHFPFHASYVNSTTLDSMFAESSFPPLGDLLGDLQTFSRRHLTYEQDVLDAFRGILARSDYITVWGVPIIGRKIEADPSAGFAIGLAWRKRQRYEIKFDSYPKSHVPASWKRRAGFPTWSWTSVIGEIYTEGIIFYSSHDHEKEENNAEIAFWMYWQTQWKPLNDVLTLTEQNALPEQSPELLVEGTIVPVCPNTGPQEFSCFLPGLNDSEVLWACVDFESELKPHLHTEHKQHWQKEHFIDETWDALVLYECTAVNWGKKSVLMLLLGWVADGRAERVGFLEGEIESSRMDHLPRVRKKFILQ
ncbi:MAG: hypothetical protein Q9227_001156 [Pyrenula ochraceoflavens]